MGVSPDLPLMLSERAAEHAHCIQDGGDIELRRLAITSALEWLPHGTNGMATYIQALSCSMDSWVHQSRKP